MADSEKSPARELIFVRNYKLAEAPPSKIDVSKSMVRFVGLDPSKINKDLIWGVQGTNSIRDADRFAAADAQARKLQIYQMDVVYRIPNLHTQQTSLDEHEVARLGYLHSLRMTAAFRKKLCEQFAKWLFEAKDPEYADLVGLDFDEMVQQRPMLIHRLMKEVPFLNAVVHPVLLNGGVVLRIATLRNKPEFIERVFTRFHEEIETVIGTSGVRRSTAASPSPAKGSRSSAESLFPAAGSRLPPSELLKFGRRSDE